MTYQIVVLGTSKQPDGAFTVSGVFWLTAPTSKIVPQPGFRSQVPNVDSATLLALQVGTLVEEMFTTGMFANGTDLATVQTDLQNKFTSAQAALDAAPLTGLIGSVFDGNSWQQSTPFSLSTPSEGMLVRIPGVTPTAQGRLPTAAARPIAPKLTFITPNWCDRTTWYVNSIYIDNETATDSGDHTTYSLAHQYIVDAYHGKITFEDTIKDSSGRSYLVMVKVNGATKAEQDPHVGSGGDYTINYVAGAISFLSALQPSDVVTVSYHYAQRATFIITPEQGKRLYVGTVEVQFSEDIIMNDTFVFQAYGLVDVFAPQYMSPPYNVPSGTKIPLGDPLIYKTFGDLLNDSNGAYPGYPAFGGSNWRALKKQAYIFVWDYTVGMTCLESAYGMEIHVDLQHDVPCGGTFGVATFYCTSENE